MESVTVVPLNVAPPTAGFVKPEKSTSKAPVFRAAGVAVTILRVTV